MATDLYVGGWDNPSQQAVFGKIDSETGAYTQISSGLGLTFDSFTGLAWDPGISAFHTLSKQGLLSTITKTGTTGSPTGGGPRGRGRLAYNTNTGQLHRLAGKDPDRTFVDVVKMSINGVDVPKNTHTEELHRLAVKYLSLASMGYSFNGTAFVKGKLYCTVSKRYHPEFEFRFENSGENNDSYGLFDLETARFQEIFPDRAFQGMCLAYDGSTLFGLNDYTLYTLNPETGAYTQVAKVTGISEGNTILNCMSAIPVSAS
ncbi:MAG: hypothetical protein WCJ40_18560 [Planctomycetota bacterium]